jgi:hypothetical protein
LSLRRKPAGKKDRLFPFFPTTFFPTTFSYRISHLLCGAQSRFLTTASIPTES